MSRVVVIAAIVETALLTTAEQPIFATSVVATGIGLSSLCLTWLAIGWGASLILGVVHHLNVNGHRKSAVTSALVTAVVVMLGSIAWIASWVMYHQVGRFGGWDALQFVFEYDVDDLWTCMGPGEQVGIAAIGLATPFAIAALCYAILRLSVQQRPASRSRLAPAGVFVVALSLFGIFIGEVIDDPSETRVAVTAQAVTTQSSPAVTMLVSVYRASNLEPIEPVLEIDELAPIPTHEDRTRYHVDNPTSVLVVAFESLRGDIIGYVHNGIEVTPNMNRLAKRGTVFSRSYAQSTHSDYADVCLMSSLYPLRTREHHYYRRDDPWPKRLAFDHFSDAGYLTAVISSQNETWGGMENFLGTPALDLVFHADRAAHKSHVASRDPGFAKEVEAGVFTAGSLPDDLTASRAVKWMTHCHEANEPFLISMNLQSSHFPYWTPLHDTGESTGPFQPSELEADVTFLYHDPEQTPQVWNSYCNALHYADAQLGRMIDRLEELGRLDDTLVVIVGENGEAFREGTTLSGQTVVGHAGAAVEKAVHVATIMHCPDRLAPSVNDEPFEAVDILPTIAALCRLPNSDIWQGRDALAEERQPPEERMLFFHVNTSIEREDAVLLGGRWKYRIAPETGAAKLFDVLNDPDESNDLSAENVEIFEQLKAAHRDWRQRQLAYYTYPQYYRSYCPPKAPGRDDLDRML